MPPLCCTKQNLAMRANRSWRPRWHVLALVVGSLATEWRYQNSSRALVANEVFARALLLINSCGRLVRSWVPFFSICFFIFSLIMYVCFGPETLRAGFRFFFLLYCRGACRERVEAMTSGDDAPFLFIMNIQVGFTSVSYLVTPFLLSLPHCRLHARVVCRLSSTLFHFPPCLSLLLPWC